MKEIEQEILENMQKFIEPNDEKNKAISKIEEAQKAMTKKRMKGDLVEIKSNNNFSSTLQNLIKLNDENRIKIFEGIKCLREAPFDFFLLYADYKRNTLSGNKIHPIVLGGNYTMIKSMLRKRLIILQNDQNDKNESYISLGDISKLSLKDRLSYKNHQKETNSKYNIYEDIKEYIEKEINTQQELDKLKTISENNSIESTKIQTQVDEIFDKVVIQDLNEMMVNNVLDNKKIYMALVIVRKERLLNLYEKLKEHNEKLKL